MMEERRDGIRVLGCPATALAPSLRQYELDQVQRVTALRKPAVSQPLVGTPLVNALSKAAAGRFVNMRDIGKLILTRFAPHKKETAEQSPAVPFEIIRENYSRSPVKFSSSWKMLTKFR